MPYITKIKTIEFRGIPPLEIALVPPEGRPFRHLVLTGPNGTGKTSVLGAIAARLCGQLYGEPGPYSAETEAQFSEFENHGDDEEIDLKIPIERSRDLVENHAGLTWTAPLQEISQQFKEGRMIAVYLPARREINTTEVKAISTEARRKWSPLERATPRFLQFLVNRKAQQSFARDDDDNEVVARSEKWFHELEHGMAEILGTDELRLDFDRKALTFYIVVGNQRFNLLELAHGHAAAFGILAEILMRVELSHHDTDRSHDSGVVLIDEPEMHLHLELQERILPALVKMFPRIQFIVATHSPVVVSSIDDAIVFDLEDRQPRRSEDLRGRPYGWIMKRHFGLEEDFDLATTELLHELDTLRRLESPTPEQQARLEELAEQLSGTSHALALEVWNRVLASRLERREAQRKAEK